MVDRDVGLGKVSPELNGDTYIPGSLGRRHFREPYNIGNISGIWIDNIKWTKLVGCVPRIVNSLQKPVGAWDAPYKTEEEIAIVEGKG